MSDTVRGGVALAAAGAALGALLRAGAVELTPPGMSAVWVIVLVNVAGSFLLGALPALRAVRRSPALSVFLGPGVLGGFTTVSAYALTTHDLISDDPLLAALHLIGTLALAVPAAALGRALVRRREADR